MRKIMFFLCLLLCAGIVFADEAQTPEGDTAAVATEESGTPRRMMITAEAGFGFPTHAAVGIYLPINLPWDLPLLTGADVSLMYGLTFGAPELFANKNQAGLVDFSDTLQLYRSFPEGGLDGGLTGAMGLKAFLTIYELDLGFMIMPLKFGFALTMGGTYGTEGAQYTYSEFILGIRADARISAIPFLVPFLEIGIGPGNVAAPKNNTARSLISGLASAPSAWDMDDPDYPKWYNAQWLFTSLLLNAGVRFEFNLPGPRQRPAATVEPEREPEPEPEPEPVLVEQISDFLFPRWLVDIGGTVHYPGAVMDGAYSIGIQQFFGRYSFKYMSSMRGDSWTQTYQKDDILEVIQSDFDVYHVRLQGENGPVEFKIYRLQAGVPIEIDGQLIDPIEDSLYFDGMVFGPISTGF